MNAIHEGNMTTSDHARTTIRTVLRGAYNLQKLRIQTGNRITQSFKVKLGQTTDGMSETELAKEEKKILDSLRESYRRITDGIVLQSQSDSNNTFVDGKLPDMKKFKGDELITTYVELVLIDQYMTLLYDEEQQFARIKKILTTVPIYNEFLSKIDGVGPAMAGVIVCEIDIFKSKYPSSIWKLAGLDVVTVGYDYKNDGKIEYFPLAELFPDGEGGYTRNGKKVELTTVGRSRQSHCLVDKEYTTADGETAMRKSITFKPFLKTKLVGVLASSFLRTGGCTVNGKKTGTAKRLELAIAEGFKYDKDSEMDKNEQVIEFLRSLGNKVEMTPSPYGSYYYNYRNRLRNDPVHSKKTDIHQHNMAMRYMIKRFIVDLYMAWRKLENLEVHDEYAIGKLGMTHGGN